MDEAAAGLAALGGNLDPSAISSNPLEMIKDLQEQFELTVTSESLDGEATYVLEGPIREEFRQKQEAILLSDPDALSPRQALEALYRLKKLRRDGEGDGKG